MSYLELLRLEKEPFSNSPDPDAYYASTVHETCINRLEIAIRLKRGLNVVLGFVGTGKSTLARCLLRRLHGQERIEPYLLIDAGPEDSLGFIRQLAELLAPEVPDIAERVTDERTGLGILQSLIYDKALERGISPVLIIDEGQKLSPNAMEVLRELLNFETNTEKLLQIVIFAQPEFREKIEAAPNFQDRINELLELTPLSVEETSNLIRHRLRLAGGQQAEALFSSSALSELCRASGGRPRQMVRLGHQCLLSLIMTNGRQVTAKTVKALAERSGEAVSSRRSWIPWAVAAVVLSAVAALFLLSPALRAQMDSWRAGLSQMLAPAPASPDRGEGPKSGVADASKEKPAPEEKGAQKERSGQAAAPAKTEASVGASGKTSDTSNDAKAVSDKDSLGILHSIRGEKAADIALLVYGTSSAAQALSRLNPDLVSGEPQDVVLPLLEFTVPQKYTRRLLLSFMSFANADDACDAVQKFKELDAMILPVREDGGIRFHLIARNSFSSSSKAWGWLSGRNTPPEVNVALLQPFEPGETSLAQLPR